MLLENDENIFAYTRTNRDSTLLVVCNFYDKTLEYPLKQEDEPMELLISNYKDAEKSIRLRPYEARMYLKKLKP